MEEEKRRNEQFKKKTKKVILDTIFWKSRKPKNVKIIKVLENKWWCVVKKRWCVVKKRGGVWLKREVVCG